jgi:hypothetical protein
VHHRLGGRRGHHVLHERRELQLHEQLLEPLHVRLADHEAHRVDVHVEVAADGHQVLREPSLVRVLEQRLARPLLLHLLRVREDRL